MTPEERSALRSTAAYGCWYLGWLTAVLSNILDRPLSTQETLALIREYNEGVDPGPHNAGPHDDFKNLERVTEISWRGSR